MGEEQNKDEVCPPSEAENNQSRIPWQGHSLQPNASKVHLTRGQTRLGRSMRAANKKRPRAEHTQTHKLVGEAAAWQRLTDSSKATCGQGFGWGPSQNQEAWHQDYTEVTHQMGQCEYKYDTRRNRAVFTPWNCSLPCTPSPFHVNTCDICGAEDYFGDTGLLQNTRSGDKIYYLLSWSQETPKSRNTVSVFPDCVKFCISVDNFHVSCKCCSG